MRQWYAARQPGLASRLPAEPVNGWLVASRPAALKIMTSRYHVLVLDGEPDDRHSCYLGVNLRGHGLSILGLINACDGMLASI
jgi:hypothetical protein